jgi:ADP-heptose:LPS heptosyltransferase
MIDERWQSVKRILAVRLDNVGDVLVTTPALRGIKESLPGVHLTLLARPNGAQVARCNPDIDEVILYQAPWMDPWERLSQDSDWELRFIADLKARQFDGAIIFTSVPRQSSLPAAYLCYLAGIPLRAAASIDGSGSLLTTRHKHPDRLMHEVERNLDLIAGLGFSASSSQLVLQIPEQAYPTLADVLPFDIRRRVQNKPRSSSAASVADPLYPLVVLHPGCSMPIRTYPWEGFAAVADLLIDQLGATVVLTGAADEQDLVERIQQRMRHRVPAMTGILSFEQLSALIDTADLIVTNNTGPMHIAAAVKTPVVALFALTHPPDQWKPWDVPHRLLFTDVPCRYCYITRYCPTNQECLRTVTPDMIVDAATELLSRYRSGI